MKRITVTQKGEHEREDDMDLNGKKAIVTGASSGIGSAVARRFGRAGAGVVVHFNSDRQGAEDTVKSLPGTGHVALGADLADPGEVGRFMDEAIGTLGGLDIVVNNAGIYELHPITAPGFEVWRKAWERTIGVNLLGPAHICYHAVSYMIEHGGGRIINVTSRGAFRGEPEAPAYGASKAGLNAMSQSLAKALGSRNIYVFAIAPGYVDTPMAAPHLEGPEGESIIRQSPLGRVASPDEIARAVLFLATPGSEYMTGCILDMNGASYLRS